MYNYRFHLRKLSLWILVIIQIIVVTSYYYSYKPSDVQTPTSAVTFVKYNRYNATVTTLTYHTRHSLIKLKDVPTRDSFTDFNTSLCFTNGTDLKAMNRTANVNWKCVCLQGWHGMDCSQPEVIWRAFLAYRKPIQIKGPRKYQRRIVYAMEATDYGEVLTEIRVNELKNAVDLFVLYEINSNHLKNKLNGKFLKNLHYKILYLGINDTNSLWNIIRSVVVNLNPDDIILAGGVNEIPNKLGVTFFKFYNDWPELINFRLKYSVYGFFWAHPSKTVVTGGATTVRFLNEVLNGDLMYLSSNKTLSNLSSKNFIIGDLNHYGGWFCEFCSDPSVIIDRLRNRSISWDKVNLIDNNYIENLIENGVYIDGKTNLVHAHRYRENYFAPSYASDNTWKFDFLLSNMFSKMDYYE